MASWTLVVTHPPHQPSGAPEARTSLKYSTLPFPDSDGEMRLTRLRPTCQIDKIAVATAVA